MSDGPSLEELAAKPELSKEMEETVEFLIENEDEVVPVLVAGADALSVSIKKAMTEEGFKLLPHQQTILDAIQKNGGEIAGITRQMGKPRRFHVTDAHRGFFDPEGIKNAFVKLGASASTAAEAARNFNAAYRKTAMTFHTTVTAAQRKAERKRRVEQTYRSPTRAERATEHAIRMNMKKKRRAEIEPGFEPVANKAVTAYFQAQMVAIAKANEHLKPHEIQNAAYRRLAEVLPERRRDMFTLKPDRSKQTHVKGYCKPNVRPKSARVPRQLEAA